MPRSLRGLCAAATVTVAVLAAGALLAGPSASACTTEVPGGCEDVFLPPLLPPLPAEGEHELIGDLPASGGVAIVLWGGGPSGAIGLEAERRGCTVSALYANGPDGRLARIPHYWSSSMPELPASSPVLVVCAPRLVGRVLDADGEPVGGVRVNAYDVEQGGTVADTAEDGRFAFRPSDTGTFVLGVSFYYDDVHRFRGHIGWYGPGGFTTELDKATEITVGRSGAEVEIRLPVAPIRGVVIGPDGKPRDKVIVEARGRDGLRSGDVTAPDGAFAVPTVAGERVVLALYEPAPAEAGGSMSSGGLFWNIFGWYGPGGFTTERGRAAQVVSGGPDGVEFEIRLVVHTVGGVVRGPDGEPLRATVQAHNGDINNRAATAPDGSFSVAMPPGRVTLAVLTPDGHHVGWYGPGGFTLDHRQAISVLLDADVTDLDVRLPTVHSIRGVLRRLDASSSPHPYGRLWTYADGHWVYLREVYVHRDGDFRILVADGVYAIELGVYDPEWTFAAVHDVAGGVTYACGSLIPFEVDGGDVTGVAITLPGVAREDRACP